MEISLDRIYTCDEYTIGLLYINGEYFCDVLEDCDRYLEDSMSENEIMSKKVKCQTAIPTGRYQLTLNVKSPRFSRKDFYVKLCNGGYVPRILDVKGFSGILIHIGNEDEDSCGCLLLGENKVKGKVINSRNTFTKFYNKIKNVKEDIFITISRQYKK